MCICTYFVVGFAAPPGNTTVCRGVNTNIDCGYQSASALPVAWIINGTFFTQEQVANSPLYQLNNPTSPPTLSLTVLSINGTTTFQCIVLSTPNTISTHGTVTVIGMFIHRYSRLSLHTSCHTKTAIFSHDRISDSILLTDVMLSLMQVHASLLCGSVYMCPPH